MIVSLKEFNTYTGNMEMTAPEAGQKENMLRSAERIVIDYLGYDPCIQERHDVLSGIGSNRLYLRSQSVLSVSSLKIDNRPVDTNLVQYHGSYITIGSPFPRGVDNIEVSYSAGFTDASYEMDLVKLSIKRIASLMLQESNGNIGLSGKSFADQSRTYINYSNYDKYLQPLNCIAVVRFD